MKILVPLLVLAAAASVSCSPKAESIGEVDTVFKLLGPDHKIVVDAYDDPKVGGVTCYVSRGKTGGIRAASAWPRTCRSLDRLPPGRADLVPKPLEAQEEMFSERISLVFRSCA
jgi:CreA protein